MDGDQDALPVEQGQVNPEHDGDIVLSDLSHIQRSGARLMSAIANLGTTNQSNLQVALNFQHQFNSLLGTSQIVESQFARLIPLPLAESRTSPSNRRSPCKSQGQQGCSTTLHRRPLVSQSMQLPAQPDRGEWPMVLPLTVMEQVMEENTEQLLSDMVSGRTLEGRAQDVPRSPAVQVRRKHSQVSATAAAGRTVRNGLTCEHSIVRKAPPRRRAQSWNNRGLMQLVINASSDGDDDTCKANTVRRRDVSGALPGASTSSSDKTVDAPWGQNQAASTPTACEVQPQHVLPQLQASSDHAGAERLPETGMHDEVTPSKSFEGANSASMPPEIEQFCSSSRTRPWGAARTGHGARPLPGWWCDDAACDGQDVFVSLRATPDTTDLPGYMSVALPHLWSRAEDCASPALSEDSADFVINIDRGLGMGMLDAKSWMDAPNLGFTRKSCQSEQHNQQRATLATRRPNTPLSHRSAQNYLSLRSAHLVHSLSCGPGSGPKDPTPARRPLPSSEVTLGSEDTHSSPSTFDSTEMIGPQTFAGGTVPASGSVAFCQQQKPQQPQRIVAESSQMAVSLPTRNADSAKSPLQKQTLPHGPRCSSSRGSCFTNKGDSDAQFFRPLMQQSISNDAPACKRKELVPVRQSLFFLHLATSTDVADLIMPLQAIPVSDGSKIKGP